MEILESTKFVVEDSELVKINHEKVIEFSKNFSHGDAKHWLSVAPFNFSHFSDQEKLHFLFLFNALSFSYWGEPKWNIEHKGTYFDGAWGMIVALGRAIENGARLLDFEFCAEMSEKEFAEILRANIEIPLFTERLRVVHEIGIQMVNIFRGQAENIIMEAQGGAIKLLLLILENFPSFRDSSPYKGKEIYFEKRAQLLVADIYQIFGGRGFGALRDIDQITACADYKLPQILRKLGILEYAAGLAEKIDNKIEIPHGSTEEVEIRASTIWAVEFIKEGVRRRTPHILSFEINDHLWLLTQEKFPDDRPYHRTRTTAY